MKQIFSLITLLLTITIVSCTKDETTKNNIGTSNYTFSIDQAIKTANKIFLSNNLKSALVKKVVGKKTFFDENNNPYFHIINMEGEGHRAFIIISGDMRKRPVLAYSDNNFFPIDTAMPYGVTYWINNQKKQIDSLRAKQIKQKPEIKKAWDNVQLPIKEIVNSRLKMEPEDDPTNCTGSYTIIKNPLLTTTWGQWCVYNEQCPTGNCGDGTCSHKPTGCVATAIAQVLQYWHYGTAHNWNIIRNKYTEQDFNEPGATEIAGLMKHVGALVNMIYSCNGSYPNPIINEPNYIGYTFNHFFGYS